MKLLIVFTAVLSIAAAGTIPSQSETEIEVRITNGQPARADQFPYQVGLSLMKSILSTTWCGVSLIGNTWVLTAAHCTDGAQSVTVYLGSTVYSSYKVSYIVDKSQIIQHTGYNASIYANDISLIRIPSVAYTSSIQPIRLPIQSCNYSTYDGAYAIASGWGYTSDSSPLASNLNYARLQVVSNKQCAALFGTSVVTSNTICVATPQGVSTCYGDSGGPLVLEGQNILIGVTSFVSRASCVLGYEAGFARVTAFLPWIKQHTGISY